MMCSSVSDVTQDFRLQIGLFCANTYFFVSSLLETALNLLVDEHSEVRQMAALFVREVATNQKLPGVQVSLCLQTMHNLYFHESYDEPVIAIMIGDNT